MKRYYKYLLLMAALGAIALGAARQEHRIILQKAVTVCLECIGVG